MSEFPIILTESALKASWKKLHARPGPVGALRLGIKGGGCSGFSYVLTFEDVPARATDLVSHPSTEYDPLLMIEDKDQPVYVIEVRCDPKSALVLRGTVLDYVDNGLNGRGFVFSNPQERSKCGCGSSFSV